MYVTMHPSREVSLGENDHWKLEVDVVIPQQKKARKVCILRQRLLSKRQLDEWKNVEEFYDGSNELVRHMAFGTMKHMTLTWARRGSLAENGNLDPDELDNDNAVNFVVPNLENGVGIGIASRGRSASFDSLSDESSGSEEEGSDNKKWVLKEIKHHLSIWDILDRC